MIFLQDNVYFKRDLKFEDIKSRLLGMFVSDWQFAQVLTSRRTLGNMCKADRLHVVRS